VNSVDLTVHSRTTSDTIISNFKKLESILLGQRKVVNFSRLYLQNVKLP